MPVAGECIDIDECQQPDHGGCSPDASCRNIAGSRLCTCDLGFVDQSGDGTQCVNRCDLAGCDAHASCTLAGEQASCQCTSPYVGDGMSCAFDAACALLGCDVHAECKVTGSDIRECSCAAGYEGSGTSCTNVDECAASPTLCGDDAHCTDTDGSYHCDCDEGFEPVGGVCSNIDDCTPQPCQHGGVCTDAVLGFSCDCTGTGYAGDRCQDLAGPCCSSGDCLCHGPTPTALTSAMGPYQTTSYALAGAGCVYYPTDALPPFAAVTIADGFTGLGGCSSTQTGQWGPLYASYGLVTMIVDTGSSDQPNTRGTALLHGVAAFKLENTNSSSPLSGKLAGRYGTSGFSMGGGGTTYAAQMDSTLLTNVAIMPWGPVANGITVPSLYILGSSDTLDGTMGLTSYNGIAASVPKMIVTVDSVMAGQPSDGAGAIGQYGLAFQKVFLEGDERWRPFLVAAPSDDTTIH